MGRRTDSYLGVAFHEDVGDESVVDTIIIIVVIISVELYPLSEDDGEDANDKEKTKRALHLSKAPKLTTVAFQIDSEQVETVKRQTIKLNYLLMK